MSATDDPRTTEALPASAGLRATVRECRLTVIAGDGEHTTHVFAAERFVIGADPRADLALPDSTLSKFHCELRIADGLAVVRDLGSRNGTVVDRVPVIEAPLRDGAILTLGRTQLRFEIGARKVEVVLSPRDHFGRLRGTSIAMRAIYPLLEAAATGFTTVQLSPLTRWRSSDRQLSSGGRTGRRSGCSHSHRSS